jgi:hypothetical protein
MTKTTEFKIEVTSVPHHDDLVAELWRGDEQVAQLRRLGMGARVQLYPQRSGAAWDFELSDFLSALEQARTRLDE